MDAPVDEMVDFIIAAQVAADCNKEIDDKMDDGAEVDEVCIQWHFRMLRKTQMDFTRLLLKLTVSTCISFLHFFWVADADIMLLQIGLLMIFQIKEEIQDYFWKQPIV